MRLVPVLLLLLIVLAVTPGAAFGGDVLVPDCGNLAYGGSAMPAAWSSGCTGSSVNLQGLRWSGWGAPVAVATGASAYNGCDPDCATAPVHWYPAELRVERIRRCASSLGTRSYYTRATVTTTFPEGNEDGQPAGASTPNSFSVPCPTPGYLIGLGTQHARLGPFVDDGAYDASRIELLFGQPASERQPSSYLCVKRWPRLGMTAEFVVFGTDRGDPCDAGMFNRAVLTAPRWHTADGVRPGVSERLAAHHSRRRCTRGSCGSAGYGYALHRSECAGGRYPAVIAQIAHGHVTRLVVYKRWCE